MAKKRYGHSSLLGVVFIMAIEPGEVLDFKVRSKIIFNVDPRKNGT